MAGSNFRLHPTSNNAPIRKETIFLVRTDASSTHRRPASIALVPSEKGPAVKLLSEARTPYSRTNKFNRRNPIIGVEILDPLGGVGDFSKQEGGLVHR